MKKAGFFLVAFACVLGVCIEDARAWEVISQSAATFNDIWGTSSADVFVVGTDGTILHNDGAGWVAMTSGTTYSLNGVWGSSSDDVFAIGDHGTILHYDGSSWSGMNSPTVNSLNGIWGSSPADVYAVGEGTTLLHYDGSLWTAIELGINANWNTIWGSSASNIRGGGDAGYMLCNLGSGWGFCGTASTSDDLYGMWGSSSTDVYWVGSGGVIHYDGIKIAKTYSSAVALNDVSGSSWNNIFAVGMNGRIIHYDGSAWTVMGSGVTDQLNGVWSSSQDNAYAVGAFGTILHYDGSAWSTDLTSPSLYGIWGSSSEDVFAVGERGTILHTNGSAWSLMPSPYTNTGKGIWGASSSDVFVVGGGGGILRYDGSVWSAMTSPTTNSLNGIWGSSLNDVFAVGARGTILHYNGATWSSMASGTTDEASGVWGSSSTDVFVTLLSGRILHYDGLSWSFVTPTVGAALNGIWGSSSSDVYAVGNSGKILHFDGMNWSAMVSGTTSHINGIWGSSSSDIYAVGAQGVILHSDGSAWVSMASGTTDGLGDVWGSAWSDVYAVGLYRGLLHSGPSVNDSPVAFDQSLVTNEDTELSIVLRATDSDHDPIEYSIVSSPTHGTLTGVVPNVVYAPTANYYGTDTFTFRAYDGKVEGNVASVTITIAPSNDPPVAGDQSVSTRQNTAVGVVIAATDVDGDSLAYTVLAGPVHGTLTGTPPGLTYTPTVNYSGPDLFAFIATDGQASSNIAIVTINVSPLITLPAALDFKGVWATGGVNPWFGQNAQRHDGVDAAQSGSIADGQTSWLKTTVVGPKKVTFWWKTSSEPADRLTFYVDTTKLAWRSGISGWQQKSFLIGGGTHVVKWSFTRNASGSAGMNAGFVDQVRIVSP